MGKSYRELIVWNRGIDLVKQVYATTQIFPREEMYGLTAQMRRAAVSVPSNIAEGQARHSAKEFQHFISISRGSLAEIETQVFVANELGYIGSKERDLVLALSSEIGRMLNRLYDSLDTIKRPAVLAENREQRTENCE